MHPDFPRRDPPEDPHRWDTGDRPFERSSTGSNVALGVAFLIGVVPFFLVAKGVFDAVEYHEPGLAVFFGAALLSPFALAGVFGWAAGKRAREEGRAVEPSQTAAIAGGAWFGVGLLLVATVYMLGMELGQGLRHIPW